MFQTSTNGIWRSYIPIFSIKTRKLERNPNKIYINKNLKDILFPENLDLLVWKKKLLHTLALVALQACFVLSWSLLLPRKWELRFWCRPILTFERILSLCLTSPHGYLLIYKILFISTSLYLIYRHTGIHLKSHHWAQFDL